MDSLNPVWNQTFDFVVEDGLHDMLILEVWDHDTFGKVKISFHLYSAPLLTCIAIISYEKVVTSGLFLTSVQFPFHLISSNAFTISLQSHFLFLDHVCFAPSSCVHAHTLCFAS